MPLDFEIMPERGITNDSMEFTLGMPFQFAVTSLRKQHTVVKSVHVIFNELDPLANDLVVALPGDGLRLYFDPHSQTLKVIEIADLSLINLKYCGSVISLNGDVPSLDKIDHCFGATHPGVYDSVNQVFELKFRGLQFQFPADPGLVAAQMSGLGAVQFEELPLVSKMQIYSGNNLLESAAPSVPPQYFYGNIFAEKVEGTLGENNKLTELKFTFIREDVFSSNTASRSSEKKKRVERFMKLGDSCDRILSDFGAPNKLFYKPDDKMRIHTPSGSRLNDDKVSHYFLNYFTLGVDVLMDGEKHTVKKIILHTNFPCHYHFNIYHRCQFNVSLPYIEDGKHEITPFTKWDSILDICSHDKPVVLTRASCDNNTNPFGPTFCYNIANIIIEVMQNSYIASLTIFDTD
ncbi:phagosome assembly factor 1-like [Convolutriloba macropyga]|uniref:phagosome assembly factor 1-like n=1 Tax=Convolutriloba macropyga TaxID=536237 RepID=UPI003F5227A1